LTSVGSDARAEVVPAAVEDRWILSRLARAQASVRGRIEAYDFAHAALSLYDFVYGELCDWYLELIKPRLRAGEPDLAATVLHVLTETLALAHPLIPFVTEEIWSYVPGAEGLLAARVSERPVGSTDEEAEATVGRMIEAVQALRGWRESTDVKPSAELQARFAAEGYDGTVEHIARLGRLAWVQEPAEAVASVAVPGGAIEILPSDALDTEAASRRDEARRATLQSEIKRSEGKLANEGFVAKAPAEIVQAERDKLARLRAELDAL
jgi:valyl-tRNA synthetase